MSEITRCEFLETPEDIAEHCGGRFIYIAMPVLGGGYSKVGFPVSPGDVAKNIAASPNLMTSKTYPMLQINGPNTAELQFWSEEVFKRWYEKEGKSQGSEVE